MSKTSKFPLLLLAFMAVSCTWWNFDETEENTHQVAKENCIFVVSKVSPEHLSVYEILGSDTVFVKSYPVSVGVNRGSKTQRADGKTPESGNKSYFKIIQISDSRNWKTEAGDSRGRNAFGPWFMKLDAGGFSGIGIYGSDNSTLSIPGRSSSDGCIIVRKDDIKELYDNYAHVGTKVYILKEGQGPMSFETFSPDTLFTETNCDKNAGKMLAVNAPDNAPFDLYNEGKVSFNKNKDVKVSVSPKKGPTFGTGHKVVVDDIVIPECLTAPAEPVKKPEVEKKAEPAKVAEKKKAEEPKKEEIGTCVVKGTRQNVRIATYPNPKDNPIWTKNGKSVCPEDGEVLQIVGEAGDYYKVKFSGETVFINKVSVVKK